MATERSEEGGSRLPDTRARLLDAARSCLLEQGFARLSTRRVAAEAGVPLSQIHYHFGGKRGLVLELLDHENARLLGRQQLMYGKQVPLWERYEQACDFLEEDLASGYVRVLQEMIAAGWSDEDVATAVLAVVQKWVDLLEEVSMEAEKRFGSLGPFTPRDLGTLVGLSFLGGEQLILLGDEQWTHRVLSTLRQVGALIRSLEGSE
jgi:AcrR family transcriptional regulator